MTGDETEVLAATRRFYDALEDMITGRGLARMDEAWEHSPAVTSGHPTGDWARGWDEIRATWEVFSTIGSPDKAGSRVRDLRVRVLGEVAYTTGVFVTSPHYGTMSMNVTNILRKVDGAWKIIHHHADRTPSLDTLIEEGLKT